MRLDVVLITTGSRPRLLQQSLRSLRENASDWGRHSLTLVLDGCSIADAFMRLAGNPAMAQRIIISTERQGASRSRNIGASSTPSYLRKDMVMFLDDDFYAVKGWDSWLDHIANFFGTAKGIYSLHAHPYNHTVVRDSRDFYVTNVISTVHMAMSWTVWDAVGFFAEPGGAGGSEDVDYCNRAVQQLNAPLVVSKPQHILHTGIGSSTGSKLVGWEQVMENNRRLEHIHGLEGKVIYG